MEGITFGTRSEMVVDEAGGVLQGVLQRVELDADGGAMRHNAHLHGEPHWIRKV